MVGHMLHWERYQTRNQKQQKLEPYMRKVARQLKEKMPTFGSAGLFLENKMGNIRRARELFDAATVADKRRVAVWHGWAVLEIKQGNVKKARQLLAKGPKFCGGNEYIYQTLAMLEAKAKRYEQARQLF